MLFESGGTGPLARPQEQPVPESLDWDLWIGPAPMRPYHPGYLPPQFPGAGGVPESPALIGWNRWRDFGGGALGGAGSHSLNLAFKAFDLQSLWDDARSASKTIRVTTEISERCPENFPRCQIVHFDLPARGAMPAGADPLVQRVERGDQAPRHPRSVWRSWPGSRSQWEQGSWSPHSFLLIVGSKGMALANFHNSVCKLLPEKDFPDAGGPPQRLPRSGSHEREWVAACKGGPMPMSNFDHSGPDDGIAATWATSPPPSTGRWSSIPPP